MSVILTYDDLLARVQVSGSAVTGSAADVDRSCDGGITYTRVRGGTGMPISGGNFELPVDDYEFCTGTFPSGALCPPGVTGVASTYRVCGYNAESMLTVTGGPNSYASTPDNAALDITGDIDVRMWLRPDDWTPGTEQVLISKYLISGDQRSWVLRLLTSGKIAFSWSTAGTFASLLTRTSTVAVPTETGAALVLRAVLDVNDGSGNHAVSFYTGPDMDGPWTLIGTVITTSGTTSIFSSTARLEIGAGDNGGVIFTGGGRFTGDVLKAEVRNGIDGTAVANPDFTAQTPGTTSFTDDAGRVWTVQSAAQIKTDPDPPEAPSYLSCQTGSITPEFHQVWLKSIARPFLNQPVTVLRDFADVERSARGGVFDIVGRSLPVAVTDLRGSRRWTLRLCTETAQDAHDLDLLLISGDPVFLQVPVNSNLPVPSIYAHVGDTSARKRAYSEHRTWSLPLTQVAAPGPDVIGATITWQCVLDTYATWQDVLNANASWADLLQQVCADASGEVFVP